MMHCADVSRREPELRECITCHKMTFPTYFLDEGPFCLKCWIKLRNYTGYDPDGDYQRTDSKS